MPMETNEDRVDAAVLAPLYLTLDRDGRAWKGFDWSVMNRLHDKGMIHNPVGKAKSVSPKKASLNQSACSARCSPRQFDVFDCRLTKGVFPPQNDCVTSR